MVRRRHRTKVKSNLDSHHHATHIVLYKARRVVWTVSYCANVLFRPFQILILHLLKVNKQNLVLHSGSVMEQKETKQLPIQCLHANELRIIKKMMQVSEQTATCQHDARCGNYKYYFINTENIAYLQTSQPSKENNSESMITRQHRSRL